MEWKTWGYDAQADLPTRLQAQGFVAEEPETVMIAAVGDLLDLPVAEPAGITIRQITSRQDTDRVAAMESEVWGEDWSWLAEDLFTRSQGERPLVRILVAEAGDEMVSAGWLSLVPDTPFAGLWGGSTKEPFRGRGIYRCLVARRAQLARQLGVRYLQVDASADSRPVLERLGFHALTTTTAYVWTPR